MTSVEQAAKRGHLGVTVLGSGSKGNASVIHGPDGNILLDCGFSRKDLEARLEAAGIDPGSIFAALITHAHSDHGKHFGFCKDRNIPVYLLEETLYRMLGGALHDKPVPFLQDCHCIQITAGAAFDLCSVHVESFEVPHDVRAVGYTFETGGHKIGYATDIGYMTKLAQNKLTGANILILESNYDPTLLRQSRRPLHLIRRIMSKQGHLSNSDAMSVLQKLVTSETGSVIFAHISQECNRADLVYELAETQLTEMNRKDVSFMVANQEAPLPTVWV